MKLFFLFALLLFVDITLCADPVTVTGKYFQARFTMYQMNGSSCSKKNEYYTGTMKYYYIGSGTSAGSSVREMTFDSLSADKKQYPTETYVYAADANDADHKKEFLRLNRCPACSFTAMPSNYKAEILFDITSSSSSTSFVKNVAYHDTDKTKVKSFDTPYNCFELEVPTESKTSFTEPDYFGNCVAKDCHVLMDFIFSYDFSGSMGWSDGHGSTRYKSSVTVANNIIETFASKKANAVNSDIRGTIISWAAGANIYSKSSKRYISGIQSYGFLHKDELLKDLEQYSKETPVSGTCLICGYIAMIEIGYVQFKYEFSKEKARFDGVGRVGFLLTDGQATWSTKKTSDVGPLTNCGSSGGCKGWTYEYGDGNNYQSGFKDDLNAAKSTATTYYKDHANETGGINFFSTFTIISMAAYDAESASDNAKGIYDVVGKRGSQLTSSFKTVYFFKDLSNMDSFFNSLKTNICNAFAGDADKCKSDSKQPCCSGTLFCPKDESQSQTCHEKNPTHHNVNNNKCIYDSYCQANKSACDRVKCNSGECTRYYEKVSPCFTWSCNPKTGNLVQGSSINCYDKLTDFDACKDYKCAVASDAPEVEYDKLSTVSAWTKYCTAGDDICTLDKCNVTEEVKEITDKTSCTKAKYTWNEQKHKCFHIYNYNRDAECYHYRCTVKGENSETTVTPITCDNYCHICDPANNKCKKNPSDRCLNPIDNPAFNPGTMIEGCWQLPKCEEALNNNKGGCTTPVDLCAGKTTNCEKYFCEKTFSESDELLSAKCSKVDVECILPASLPSRCYSSTCIDSKGGCYVSIDFNMINDCGDCAEVSTCDESALVITAAIGAGVVAAIVIVAVVALSVGLLASKKMYDMISGANEARMDAAQENQLYKSDEKGGDNPLFA